MNVFGRRLFPGCARRALFGLCVCLLLMTACAATPGCAAAQDLMDAAAGELVRVEGFARQLIEENAQVDPEQGVYTWDNEQKGYNWNYFTGFVMDALMESQGEASLDLVQRYYRAQISPDGSIAQYREGTTDAVEPARGLFDLLERTGSEEERRLYEKAIAGVCAQLAKQVRYEDCGGNFLIVQDEKGNPGPSAQDYQIYLDTLYMTQPFLMEVAEHASDAAGAARIRREVTERYLWIRDNMYDPRTGLVQHGWNVFDGRGNGHFWGRSVGWLGMSLADVIEKMPEGDDRDALCGFLRQVLDGMLRWQDEKTGMWFNVITRDETLSDNRLETSVSAMMAYTYMKAYLMGIAPEEHFRDAGLRAFTGVSSRKLFGEEGSRFLTDTCLKSGAGSTDEYYVKEGYKTDEGKGIGALLFCIPCVEQILDADTRYR